MASKVERIAVLAMRLSGRHMSEYGSYKSRYDFTQSQLMACLILRAYLKTTCRGLVDFLAGHQGLRTALGMEGKLPQYTTLQKFSTRSNVLAIADALVAQIGKAALGAAGKGRKPVAVAMDATGMETSTASAHFVSRSGRERRRWVKLSVVVVCGCLFPLGLVADWGPTSDKCQAGDLLSKSFEVPLNCLPQRLYADAGYDADWIHERCRSQWGIESVIKPARCRADGSLGGEHRSAMISEYLKKQGYGKRWHIESFFSGLKRIMGSALSSRTDDNLLKEAAIRVLAYTLHR